MAADMSQTTRTRMAAYPAADGNGKWHAARTITGVSACGGGTVLLDTTASPIFATPERAHPMICKRCQGIWKTAIAAAD